MCMNVSFLYVGMFVCDLYTNIHLYYIYYSIQIIKILISFTTNIIELQNKENYLLVTTMIIQASLYTFYDFFKTLWGNFEYVHVKHIKHLCINYESITKLNSTLVSIYVLYLQRYNSFYVTQT